MFIFHSNHLEVIILAAGQGKRMYSKLPKVLHSLAGIPLLTHVISAAEKLNPKKIHVVYGHGGETVPEYINLSNVHWVLQEEQLGTAHAVKQVLPNLDKSSIVLILVGDVPLIPPDILQELLLNIPKNGIGILTAIFKNPEGLGRIVRNTDGQITAIIEEKDANSEQKKIKEINTGIMAIPATVLEEYLPQIGKKNAQGEFYLTALPELLVKEGRPVHWILAPTEEHVQGVNNQKQLAALERYYQQGLVDELMLRGVCVKDPARLDIRGSVEAGSDVFIDVNVILEGQVSIGSDSIIGANCILRNVQIGERVIIKENSIIEDSIIDNECIVGPFARIRPETHLHEQSHVGNFVEIKKSDVGIGSKVNHLSYIGDCTIGKNVNIGAGTITCNYDGASKHQTIIEDDAFIGSGTQLVAPVRVEQSATIGAGSTITRDAPAGRLTVARARQCNIIGWQRPEKPENEGI